MQGRRQAGLRNGIRWGTHSTLSDQCIQRLHHHAVTSLERSACRGRNQPAQSFLLVGIQRCAHHCNHLNPAYRARLTDNLLHTTANRVVGLAL
ncbi:hypothetical protein ACEQUB_01318 [Ralstonia syzygii]